MISLDQLWILGKYLLQPYGCHILMALSAQIQGLIIFSYCLIDHLKLIGISLKLINIFRSQITAGLQILADHPLTEGSYHLTCLKIYQSQQIPCLNIVLTVNQALLQTADRP